MLGLRVGNEWLDLYPKTSVNITMINPVFDDASLGRTFSYPFKIPLTPKNKSILRQNHRLDTSKDNLVNSLLIALYIHHIQFETGVLKIKNYTNKEVQIVFQNRERNLIDELENMPLNEIFNNISIPQTHIPFYKFLVTSDPNPNVDQDVILHINNIAFVSANNNNDAAAFEIVQAINSNTELDVTATLNGHEFTIVNNSDDGLIIQFFPRLSILDHLTLPDARQMNLHDFHATIRANPIPELSMPVFYNKEFYEGKNQEFFGFINYFLGGNVIENLGYVEPAWEATYIPFIRIPYLLNKMFESVQEDPIEFIEGDFIESSDVQKLLLFNNYALDELFQYADGDGVVKIINGLKKNINLNEHVPELSALQFFKDFSFHFNLYANLKGNSLQLISKTTHLNTIVRDWTEKSTPTFIRNINLDNGFVLKFAKAEEDSAIIGTQLKDYSSGEGDTELQSNFNTIHTILQRFGFRDWYLPFLKSPGSSDELGQGQKSYSMRLLLDHGLQQTSLGEEYQQSGNNSIAVDGTQIGGRDLIWGGDRGGYELDWKGYAELIDNDTVTKSINLSIQDLLSLKKWDDFRRRIYHKEGTIQGYVKSVNFKATTNGITAAKVILVKE